jgi:hypothetical protein
MQLKILVVDDELENLQFFKRFGECSGTTWSASRTAAKRLSVS